MALLVYAYAVGVRSSRGIERHCREDVAFRVITATTHRITRRSRAFVRGTRSRSASWSVRRWRCAFAQGWVKLGVVAIDGTKIAANATHHYEQIARDILEEAAELDAAEDARYGTARGDAVPVKLRVAGDRRKRLREAKQALDAEREADAEPVARDRGPRLRECRRRLEQDYELKRRLIAEHDAWLAAGIASVAAA